MQDLNSQIQRQLKIQPPPCETEHRHDRELVPPVKKMLFPFHTRRIGFIGFASCGVTERIVSSHIEHVACIVTIPKEETNTSAMDRAELQIQNAELIVNSALITIAEDSAKETYHRKNIIEKRRRKR